MKEHLLQLPVRVAVPFYLSEIQPDLMELIFIRYPVFFQFPDQLLPVFFIALIQVRIIGDMDRYAAVLQRVQRPFAGNDRRIRSQFQRPDLFIFRTDPDDLRKLRIQERLSACLLYTSRCV